VVCGDWALLRPGALAPTEGFPALDRHVIVTEPSEVIQVTPRPPVILGKTAERTAALLRLADEHLDAAYRLARAILREPSDAQDATHDALVQASRKWSSLRDPSRFEPWFDRILINICRDRLRHASRWQFRDISGEIVIAAGDPFGQADDRDVLGNAIATLSPDHRVVVALRYYRDLQVDEIATRLGIPAGTVQSRLHYALERLHRVIDAADAKGTMR
jgi:RNA polymerase sigma-70 factor, ECF subfamily